MSPRPQPGRPEQESQTVRTPTLIIATLVAGGTILLAGCQNGSTPPTTTSTRPTTGSTTSTTARTVVTKDQCTLGVATTFQPGLSLLVSKPTDSTGPLGTGNGYDPMYGYYVTFEVHAEDVGSQDVDVYPGGNYSSSYNGFVVNETGDSDVTVNTGNTPFDGSLTSLDTTFLIPGQSDSGGVTFDVPHTSGKLTYEVNGQVVCNWTF